MQSSSPSSSEDNQAYQLVFPKACKTADVIPWLREGKQQFKQAPGAWITCMLIWFAFSILMQFIPVVGQLVASLLNYVFIGGLMLGCHDAKQGLSFNSQYMFAGFKHNFSKLISLGLVSMLVSGVILWIALGDMYPAMLSAGVDALPADVDINAVSISILIATLFLIPLMMALWFAPVLIIRHDLSVFAALRLSLVGCFLNTVPLLWYGLILLPLMLFGMFTMGLGLLIVIPVITVSVHASYAQIFLEPVSSSPLNLTENNQ